jgi:hypothetical protein
VAVVLVAGVAVLVWAIGRRSPDVVIVENRSGQRVERLQVTLGGKESTFGDIAVGAQVAAPIGPQGGDRFGVEGRLADGTMIRGHGTAGRGSTFVVLPGGQLQIRPPGNTPP